MLHGVEKCKRGTCDSVHSVGIKNSKVVNNEVTRTNENKSVIPETQFILVTYYIKFTFSVHSFFSFYSLTKNMGLYMKIIIHGHKLIIKRKKLSEVISPLSILIDLFSCVFVYVKISLSL